MMNSLAKRLWIYQSERFPLKKTAPLLAIFSAASISVSAHLSDQPLPSVLSFLAGFVLVMIIFFQMRVADEYKDHDDDRRYRPNRPIPSGVVSLRLIVLLGVLLTPLAILIAWSVHLSLLPLLILVWFWLFCMTMEFGIPKWLKARPILYLLSHMAILPLIDLLLTGIEWVPRGEASSGLVFFLGLSFINGCVLEIGRKIWSPENEIIGVETYSGLWGTVRAAQVWMLCVIIAFVLLICVATATQAFWLSFCIGAIGVVFCAIAMSSYIKNPSIAAEKRIDLLSGLWVFLCYGLAGFAPIITDWMLS